MTRCDLILRNATLVDGTGAPRRRGDVAVVGERIVCVGDAGSCAAPREIDLEGRVVAPGFIDVHTHDDRLLLSGPDMTPKVSQGVTTVVAGNCGVSLAPVGPKAALPPPMNLLGDRSWFRFPTFADYAARLEREPPAVNAALLVGHISLRAGAMDSFDRGATDREIQTMRERLAEALEAGALGLSTGLFYAPAQAAPTAEVIALAELLRPAGGIYVTHMRDESDHVTEAIEETLAIGCAAGVKVHISHHKIQGRRNFGRSRETLRMIAAAQTRQAVALDVYPYVASSTVLNRKSLAHADRTVITWSEPRPDLAGLTLDEAARRLGVSEDAAVDLLDPAGAIYFTMDEDDLRRVLSFPGTMIGSDGIPHDPRPHPRLWGTFPRVLGRYCRELGLLTLEDAVHRMTGRAASELGLSDRGTLRAGAFADLVVFDPVTVADRATFDDPCRAAAGIERVFVNGVAVWSDDRPTGARPGRVLRRTVAAVG